MSSCANAGVRRLRLLASITRTRVNESVNVKRQPVIHLFPLIMSTPCCYALLLDEKRHDTLTHEATRLPGTNGYYRVPTGVTNG
jgi:hypothetical protein